MRRTKVITRVVLLLAVVFIVSLIVLGSAFTLLPAPPGHPTPTAPPILDRPEGRPRIEH